MNPIKEKIKKENAFALKRAGICWDSYNNDTHWKFSSIDFWPTTEKWQCSETGKTGEGVESLLKHLRRSRTKNVKTLSTEQMFDIAKKVRPMNLHAVCAALRKEIYGD